MTDATQKPPREWVWIPEDHVFDTAPDCLEAFPDAGPACLFPTSAAYYALQSELAAVKEMLDQLQASREALRAALSHYANHESVIKEAYHSNDERQITCVHTFINHVAKEALAADDARWAEEGK